MYNTKSETDYAKYHEAMKRHNHRTRKQVVWLASPRKPKDL